MVNVLVPKPVPFFTCNCDTLLKKCFSFCLGEAPGFKTLKCCLLEMPQVQTEGLNFEQIRTCSNVDKFLSNETLAFSQQHTKAAFGRTYPCRATWKEKRASKFSKEENLIWCCDQNLCPCFQILLVNLQKPNHITSHDAHHIQCLSQLSTCPWHKPPASCRGLIPLLYNAVHNIKASWRNGSSVSGSSPHPPVDNKSTNKILWSNSIASGLTLWTNYIGERTGVCLSYRLARSTDFAYYLLFAKRSEALTLRMRSGDVIKQSALHRGSLISAPCCSSCVARPPSMATHPPARFSRSAKALKDSGSSDKRWSARPMLDGFAC